MTKNDSTHSPNPLRTGLSIALLGIFIIQSVVVLAEAHPLNQRGENLLGFKLSLEDGHIDQNVEDRFAGTSDSELAESCFGCHHSCHCHGLCKVLTICFNEFVFSFSITFESTRDKLKAVSPALNRQFRPPRT